MSFIPAKPSSGPHLFAFDRHWSVERLLTTRRLGQRVLPGPVIGTLFTNVPYSSSGFGEARAILLSERSGKRRPVPPTPTQILHLRSG